MQQMRRLLDFRDRRYEQFGGSCTSYLMAAWELQKTIQILYQDDPSFAIFSARFHTYLGGMFLVYILIYFTIWNKDDWRTFRTTSWHLLHRSVWVYGGILIHFLCCIFFLKLYMRPLHQLPIGTSSPLISGCVDWFFESVVGWILNSGCRLKMMVDFEFYSLGCTSYFGCFQLVTMNVFSASYCWWFFSHVVKIRTTCLS
jgi:hypothetical protein